MNQSNLEYQLLILRNRPITSVNTDIECQGCQISHLGSDRGAVVDVHLGLGVLGDGLRIWSGREEEGCVMRVVHMTVYFTSMHEFT